MADREHKWNFDKQIATVINVVITNEFMFSQEGQIHFSINLTT